ncbi:dihydrofolate reductase family protein [Streptomyces sp. 2P-4]|uniref:dihydrofolate reductase family protein n=1 Tax=Streptomyces sp. 2P-4 TaxID=2931974 RepID=UPI0032ED1A3E
MRQGARPLTFATEGIDSVPAQARRAAGSRDVQISGGADTVRQFIDAGLVSELQIHLAPLVLGARLTYRLAVPWLRKARTTSKPQVADLGLCCGADDGNRTRARGLGISRYRGARTPSDLRKRSLPALVWPLRRPLADRCFSAPTGTSWHGAGRRSATVGAVSGTHPARQPVVVRPATRSVPPCRCAPPALPASRRPSGCACPSC